MIENQARGHRLTNVILQAMKNQTQKRTARWIRLHLDRADWERESTVTSEFAFLKGAERTGVLLTAVETYDQSNVVRATRFSGS